MALDSDESTRMYEAAQEQPALSPKVGALTGFRVLDFTSIVLGPYATRILGDHGADVIKIEAISGDLTRVNGTVRNGGLSSNFLAMNRNKRSLAVDLKAPEGAEIARRLAATADVLVHNIRVAGIERLGLGYEAVRSINPHIIYCAATGFGQDGPHRERPAFDDIIQAASGVVDLATAQLGAPAFLPTLIADKTAALAVANAVLAAVVHRERTGKGQYVEVPMFETIVDFMLAEHMGGLSFEPTTEPAGYQRILLGGRRLLPTRDGFMAALPYTVEQWHLFFLAVGDGERLAREGIRDKAELNSKSGILYAAMAQATPSRTTDEWMTLFGTLDIAATPMYSFDNLPEHPHLKAVGLFEKMVHPTQGAVRTIRPTTRFTDSPMQVRTLAPELGQHSRDLLAEVGFSNAETEALLNKGIVATYNVKASGTPDRAFQEDAHV